MRRRLDLAASLVGRPRCCSWTSRPPGSTRAPAASCGTSSRELVADGATVLLTTQYLEEADQLADEIAVIDHGRVVARRARPDELKARAGGQRLEVRPATRTDGRRWADPGRGHRSAPPSPVERGAHRAVADDLGGAARAGPAGWTTPGIAVAELALRLPSLDEVFLALTGQPTDPRATDDDG